MIKNLFVILSLSLLVGGCAVFPPKLELPVSADTIEDLEPFLINAVALKSPPSISVAVLKDNQTVYAKAFGHLDSNGKAPATPESVYQWWSLT